jgi:hypothetical protein
VSRENHLLQSDPYLEEKTNKFYARVHWPAVLGSETFGDKAYLLSNVDGRRCESKSGRLFPERQYCQQFANERIVRRRAFYMPDAVGELITA